MASSIDDRNKVVTGYPVAAPPGDVAIGYPHTAASSLYQQRRRRALIASVVFLMFWVFFFFAMWAVRLPRLPEFSLASATVSPININININGTASSSELTASWDLSLLIYNPNTKLALFYDSLDASVFYDDFLLSQTQLPPFVQSTHNQTLIRSRLAVVGANVGDNVANAISLERATTGSVRFGFRVLALVHFRSGTWWMGTRYMGVYCDGLIFRTNGTGALLNPSKHCQVVHLNPHYTTLR